MALFCAAIVSFFLKVSLFLATSTFSRVIIIIIIIIIIVIIIIILHLRVFNTSVC